VALSFLLSLTFGTFFLSTRRVIRPLLVVVDDYLQSRKTIECTFCAKKLRILFDLRSCRDAVFRLTWVLGRESADSKFGSRSEIKVFSTYSEIREPGKNTHKFKIP
jgi:hypothetical protein